MKTLNFYSEHQLNHKSRFVNKIWVLDNYSEKKAIENLNILPNGCFNFALLIGKGATAYFKKNIFNFNEGIYLCSQLTEVINLTLLENSKIILIQLHPWYFSYYQNINFNNFIDLISESHTNDRIFNNNINLKSSNILQEVIQTVEKHSLKLEKDNPKQNMIEEICNTIILNSGELKVSQVLNNYDCSKRWIQAKFKKTTGLTIKKLCKIIQFRNSINNITFNNLQNSLTSISYLSGYNDQSHFIKNFKQYSKIAPSKFNPDNYILSHIE